MTHSDPKIQAFINGKSKTTLELLAHFLEEFESLGEFNLYPTKTMIAISGTRKRIAWITQLGTDFVHVVFPFKQLYPDNTCFQKIGQVPGSSQQFNHHFRMYVKEDVNAEVKEFMKLALEEGNNRS